MLSPVAVVGAYVGVTFLVWGALVEFDCFADKLDADTGRVVCAMFWLPVLAFFAVCVTGWIFGRAARLLVRAPAAGIRALGRSRAEYRAALREVEQLVQ